MSQSFLTRARTLGLTSIAVTLATSLPSFTVAASFEEVIVSARQREESLQDVPGTVTAFTAESIDRAGIERPEDFVRLTPGVSMVNAAEVGDTQVNIRGINGARDAENSFAYIVDGILMTNPAAFNREYADLQQIEILKGPQGALYGRNAAAGAVIVTTRRPGNDLELDFKGSNAGYDSTYLSATLGGAIVPDQTFYRVHANYRKSDGFYDNSFGGGNIVDDFENYNLTGRLIFQPTDALSVDLKARYGEVDAASITFNASFALPAFASVFRPALDPLFGDGFASFFDEDVNDHNFVFQPNIDPQNDQEATELSAKIDYDLASGARLTSWLLYSDVDNSLSADGTSGAFGFFNTEPTCLQSSIDLTVAGVTLPAPQILLPTDGSFGADPIFGPYTPTTCDGTQYQVRNQEDLSFEVRLTSPGDQPLRWIAGAYLLDIDREVGVNLGIDLGQGVTESLFVPQGGSNPTEQLVHDQFDSRVWAVFGQLAYDLSDEVEVSLALRYDEEKREIDNLVPVGPTTQYVDFSLDGAFTGGAPLNPGLDPTINPSGVIEDKSETFQQLQPKFSATWDVNDNFTVFGSWGIGFKSGGFNNTGASATVDLFFNQPLGLNLQIEDQFDKETSRAMEAGFKGQTDDGRLTLEAAVYRTDVEDMQFFEFLVGPFGLLRVVSNIDEVDITGFEMGASAAITDWLDVSAGINFIDSEIKKNRSRRETVGNESPYTPDYTGNVAATFDFPVRDSYSLVGGLYYTLVGPTWFHTVQDQQRTTLFDLGFPGLGTADYYQSEREAYGTLDLRVGLQGDRWGVTLFGSNVLDEEYLEEVITAPEFGGSFLHPGSEARWGVEFQYSVR